MTPTGKPCSIIVENLEMLEIYQSEDLPDSGQTASTTSVRMSMDQLIVFGN